MNQELAYNQYLRNAHAHLQRIDGRSSGTLAKRIEVATEAVRDLRAALEELQAANNELRRESEQFALAHERFETLFHGAPDAHVITDKLGTIWQANRAAALLLRYPLAHLERTPLIHYLSPESRRAFLDQMPHLDRLAPKHEFEYLVQPQFGPIFPTAMTVSTVHNAITGQVYLYWQIRSVSER